MEGTPCMFYRKPRSKSGTLCHPNRNAVPRAATPHCQGSQILEPPTEFPSLHTCLLWHFTWSPPAGACASATGTFTEQNQRVSAIPAVQTAHRALHSSADRPSGCFHLGTIRNSAAPSNHARGVDEQSQHFLKVGINHHRPSQEAHFLT